MTQVEKTEAVLLAAAKQRHNDGMIYRERDAAIAHARDLAKQLDAIADIVYHPFHSVTVEDWEAIRTVCDAKHA